MTQRVTRYRLLEEVVEKLVAIDGEAPDVGLVVMKLQAKANKALAHKEGARNPDTSPARAASAQVRQEKARALRNQVLPIIKDLQSKGLSLDAIAQNLNERNIKTDRGGIWHKGTISRVLNTP